MRRQTLLNMFNNGVNITKGNAFFRGEFKLPANALFGEKSRPTALPGIRLRRGRERVIKIEAELRLIALLVQARQLLPKSKRIMGIQRAGREVVHD